MEVQDAALLAGAGVAAGALNTLAGGGSMVLVPALMLIAGLPADVANGSSRVAVLVQCLMGAAMFARGGRLPAAAAKQIAPPVVVGAAIGAWVATQLPNRIFEPLLLGTLAVMAVALIVVPRWFAPPADSEPRPVRGVAARAGLFAAGLYGGVLQAGAGLVFQAIFTSGLRYDLVRANALKALVMLLYIVISVAIFVWAGKVAWQPAAVIGVGAVVGAWGAAKVAMGPSGLLVTKIVVLVAVIGSGIAIALR